MNDCRASKNIGAFRSWLDSDPEVNAANPSPPAVVPVFMQMPQTSWSRR